MSDLIRRSALLEKLKEELDFQCDFFPKKESKLIDSGLRIAVEIIEDAPAVDAVPIDGMFCEMMNWAVRYALGRRTYAASDTASYVLHLVPKLDDKTLTVIAQDIRERGENLGDECDAVWWRKLLEASIAEMVRRKDNGA